MITPINPVLIVKGQQPTLITKNITANGDYAARAVGAEGYSSVHVEVPGEEVYFANYYYVPYTKKISIPNSVGNATYNTPGFYLWRAQNLEEFESLCEFITTLQNNFMTPPGAQGQMLRFRKANLPFVTTYNNNCLCLRNNSELECVANLGSVGHAVATISSSAFFSGSSLDKGLGWTIHIYVNASTLADIPSAITSGQPWGANHATIVYHNSTTGEVIDELHYEGGVLQQ